MLTGAGGGVGACVARILAAEGAHLVLVDRSEAGARELAREVAEAHAFGADLSREDEVARLVARALERVGRIDALVHLAGGYAGGADVVATELEVWDRMLSVNLRSALLTIRAVLPSMLERGRGKIVTVGSRAAFEPSPNAGAYAVSKAALIKLTEVLAAELRDRNVQVNAIAPSVIDTPANRRSMPKADPATWVRPEQIAQAVVFLLESDAVTGDVLKVYGRA
ncbi:MAG: SDR family NAD(P)-dependent oxidoreductase [Gemmatimonadota bacterium]